MGKAPSGELSCPCERSCFKTSLHEMYNQRMIFLGILNLDIIHFVSPIQNTPKNLDPSYEMGLGFWVFVERRNPFYSRITCTQGRAA